MWSQQIKRFFNEETDNYYYSFGSHQSQTIKRMKAFHDMYKCMLMRKKGLKLYKRYFEFLLIPSKFFFVVIKYLTTAKQLSTEQ